MADQGNHLDLSIEDSMQFSMENGDSGIARAISHLESVAEYLHTDLDVLKCYLDSDSWLCWVMVFAEICDEQGWQYDLSNFAQESGLEFLLQHDCHTIHFEASECLSNEWLDHIMYLLRTMTQSHVQRPEGLFGGKVLSESEQHLVIWQLKDITLQLLQARTDVRGGDDAELMEWENSEDEIALSQRQRFMVDCDMDLDGTSEEVAYSAATHPKTDMQDIRSMCGDEIMDNVVALGVHGSQGLVYS